jgi:hypothetical protein
MSNKKETFGSHSVPKSSEGSSIEPLIIENSPFELRNANKRGIIYLTFIVIIELSLLISCLANTTWFYYCNFKFTLFRATGYIINVYVDTTISDLYDEYQNDLQLLRFCPDFFESIGPVNGNGTIILALGIISIILIGLLYISSIWLYINPNFRKIPKIVFYILNTIPILSYLIGFVVYIARSQFSLHFAGGNSSYGDFTFAWQLGFYFSVFAIVFMGVNLAILYCTVAPAYRRLVR